MAKPYDAGMMLLVETHLADWLTVVPRRVRGPVRLIDSDLASVTADADKVLLIDDPSPWILHVELQSKRDPSLEWRVPWYNALLEYKHQCSVHSLVVLLTKNAETPGLSGEWRRQFPGEPPYRYLRYQLLRVWELHAEELANGPWGMFPLAPLCEDAERLMPGLIRQMGQRLAEHPNRSEARELWATTDILLGLRYNDPAVSMLVKEMLKMVDLRESLSYQKIVAEGRMESLHDTLMRLGKKKFGKPTAKIVRELRSITDETRLTALSERILDVDSWKDLLADDKS